MDSQKKSLDDERYKIPGTDMLNFTKWSRENIAKDPPVFAVGDRAVFFGETEITDVGQDCDGTPLYGTFHHGHGIGKESLIRLPADWDYTDTMDYEPVVAALRNAGWTVEPPTETTKSGVTS